MFRQIGRSLKRLTRQYAEEFSQLPQRPGDRRRDSKVGIRRIRWLENYLCEGKFHDPVWATAVGPDGATYKMDGGHSSTMLANTTRTFPTDLWVITREFECDTWADMAELFEMFDHRRSLRSFNDWVNAHKDVETRLDDISATDVSVIIRGIAFAFRGCGDDEQLDEKQRISLIHEFSEFMQWARPFVRVSYLRRSGVVAAMFNIHHKDRSRAAAFFAHVAEEDHPDNHNATRTLATFLRKTNTRANQQRWKARAFYVKTLRAYSAWRDDRTTDLKYNPNAPLPKIK